MSYQVLARKWRPHTFAEMVGQEHVLKALVHALDKQRLHHAYLFTGTRGVGKTTLGRILARCLNCERGISANPCGECDSCRELLEGRFVDLIEIDAASRTKVEDMRELLDNVQYSPTRGRFKIYLIDEVHMLSNSSFNALLKTLEEPPDHVKFLFATTDPQKLPVTILSRCLQFNLKRMTPSRIVEHLERILAEEGVAFEQPALWLLARAADGSMRDSLSLTDQAIAYGENRLAANEVAAMLGTVGQDYIEAIVKALIERDAGALLAQVQSMADFSPDYAAILSDLLAMLHRITLEQAVPGSTDDALGDRENVQAFARSMSAEDAQLFYQTALIGRRDLDITPDARMGFEMTLLRMLAFAPTPPESLSEPPSRPEASLVPAAEVQAEGGEPVEPSPVPENASQQAPVAQQKVDSEIEPPSQVQTTADDEHADPEATEVPGHLQEAVPVDYYDQVAVADEPESVPEVPSPAPEAEAMPPGKPQAPEQAAPPAAAPTAVADDRTSGFSWVRDFDQLGLGGMTRTLAAVGRLDRAGEQAYTLVMDEGHFRLLNDRHRDRIKAALETCLEQEIRLTVTIGEPAEETPARWQERQREARQAAAVEAIHSDPNVEAIVKAFDGHIVEDSIQSTALVKTR